MEGIKRPTLAMLGTLEKLRRFENGEEPAVVEIRREPISLPPEPSFDGFNRKERRRQAKAERKRARRK